MSSGNAPAFTDYLRESFSETGGKCDMVAFFFRKTFELLRIEGTSGLVATNTIGQGDTRSSGLRWICTHGGSIFNASRRCKWPGEAAVLVSLVHLKKGEPISQIFLDGKKVEQISAYLFHAGGHETPIVLKSNSNMGFQGPIPRGMGFTFDDNDKSGTATPITEMLRLIEKNAANKERIFPYLGGEEINESPTHQHNRYVINFEDIPESDARKWPDLFEILKSKVLPERQQSTAKSVDKKLIDNFWQFGYFAKSLQLATSNLERVLVHAFTSQYVAFAFVSRDVIVSGPHNVFAFESHHPFCILQSRAHEIWVRFFASSLEDRIRYARTDCFETFPFPPDWETNPALEVAGREYYEYRAALMVRNDEGLTKTYNRFHDPEETEKNSPDIHQLRTLHAAMDRAVLAAYGWTDIPTTCEFLLDYEEDEDSEDAPEATGKKKGKKKKKPYRYRWPDEIRDEVLARLLALNAERAEQERLAGTTGKNSAKKTTTTPKGALKQSIMQRQKGEDELI
jgi:hypothetical protein